ncbi:MAG TPA: chloride channel protein [Gemmatimonadales bacterium]|jgi:H+/Cl- antiporter ClcA|nr:chloride channel protein [Gemmatimonadales bacterium]
MSHSASGGVPIAPSLEPAIAAVGIPWRSQENQNRLLFISALSIGIAFAAAACAEVLVALINVVTNLAFFGQLSLSFRSPATHHLGLLVILVPVIGGLVVGVMARYGSPAIRGHGIPEAMERVLYNESRISPRVTLFKPLSSAIAIGTGGPFGAEGPIIATGGALGSLIGQLLRTTADERKVLLAAGAAAGMAAIFGSPVAAVLLAIELLLFEYRSRSLVPVALASAAATGVRIALHGQAAVFPLPDIAQPGGAALTTYVVLGGVIGFVAVYVTRGLYAVEDAFDRLPVHWMWWPAIGALVVGLVGYVAPRTLGVGYDNIAGILSGDLVGRAVLVLVLFKLLSWSIALGSGTSGGTLAPLFTIGGGFGALAGELLQRWTPSLGVDPRIAGLVGMAAMFAGASRALLTSIVFAFETTRQPIGLLPLLGGCTAAYLVSLFKMRHTIMTERLARRGAPVQTEYAVDYLHQILVRDCASDEVVTLDGANTVQATRDWIESRAEGSGHQGFPVVDGDGCLVGVVTRRNITDPAVDGAITVRSLVMRPPVIIYPDNTAREAADHMVHEQVGRLPVVTREDPRRVVGILSRSDLLGAHERRLTMQSRAERSLAIVPERWGSTRERRRGPRQGQKA